MECGNIQACCGLLFIRLNISAFHSGFQSEKSLIPDKISFSTDDENVWMGVTVTRNSEKKRLDDLKRNIKAKHYHVTFEPIFDEIGDIDFEGIDWIVIGTETGHRKGKVDSRPEWVLHIADQAQTQGVPVFMKEDLLPIMGEERMIQELPEQFTKRLQ